MLTPTVTVVIMFGGRELEKSLRPWLGKVVQDALLADLLRTHYRSFTIGDLIGVESGVESGELTTRALNMSRKSLIGCVFS